LKAAKIAYKDEAGAYADFHSLRKCTATLLALGGVHPKITQQFLRHSSIELTMDAYTDAGLMPLVDAVKALPVL
jgi:integrase